MIPQVKSPKQCHFDSFSTLTQNALAENPWTSVFMDHSSLSYSKFPITKLALPEKRKAVDQQNGGTCWIHATLSHYRELFIRAKPKLNSENIRLSASFLLFYHLYETCAAFLEKIKRHSKLSYSDPILSYILRTSISEGGSDNGYTLVQRYGIVPYDVMPSNEQMNNPQDLLDHIKNILNRCVPKIRASKTPSKVIDTTLSIIHKYLCISLGTPPKTFTFTFEGNPNLSVKDITPHHFYTKYIQKYDSPRVYLTSNIPLPSNSWYQFKDMEIITGIKNLKLNVSSKQLFDSIIHSIDKGNVVFAGVSINNDFDTDRGWGDVDLYRPEIVLTKEEQSFLNTPDEELFKMKTISPNHAILFVGYGTDNGKKDGNIIYLLAENSWGTENGDDGYFRVSTEWVLQNCFEASILKECLPKGIAKKPSSKITEYECYESTGNLL